MENNNHINTLRVNKLLFVFAIIMTLVQLAWLTCEMVWGTRMSFEMTFFYVSIIAFYSGHNKILKLTGVKTKDRRGEVMVFLVFVYAILMRTLWAFKIINKVSDQLAPTVELTILVVFCSELLKAAPAIIDYFYAYVKGYNNGNNQNNNQNSNK